MVNHSRILKLLKDYDEWKIECFDCINEIKRTESERTKNFLMHGVRAYFLDFHILCEDYISIMLKELNKFKIDISAIEGMEIIKENSYVSEEFLNFYILSRRLRNRIAHRYKLPSDDELLKNLSNNFKMIEEFEEKIKELLR